MSQTLQVGLKGVGLVGPGLENWGQAEAVLRGDQRYQAAPLPALKPQQLPPNERRRTTQLIKLAIQAAGEAQQHSGIDAAELACVFASAEGDSWIVDRLCEALCLPQKPVSPTQFLNSVHNAPAGYWGIAAKAQRFSTSIAAGSASFAAGLLEAAAYVAAEGEPVLLVAYDVALPQPLAPFGDSHAPFAAALVLTTAKEPGLLAQLRFDASAEVSSRALSGELAALCRDNAAAEALRLLLLLARAESGAVRLGYHDNSELTLALQC